MLRASILRPKRARVEAVSPLACASIPAEMVIRNTDQYLDMTSERADGPAWSGASRPGALLRPLALYRPTTPRLRPRSGRGGARTAYAVSALPHVARHPPGVPPPLEHEEAVELARGAFV